MQDVPTPNKRRYHVLPIMHCFQWDHYFVQVVMWLVSDETKDKTSKLTELTLILYCKDRCFITNDLYGHPIWPLIQNNPFEIVHCGKYTSQYLLFPQIKSLHTWQARGSLSDDRTNLFLHS